MNAAASVASGDRLRLFLALRLPADTLARLAVWQRDAFGSVAARIVDQKNLHVTLAFLGGRAAGDVDAIGRELREAAAAAATPTFSVDRYRETRSVGMLVLDDPGARASSLAGDLHARLQRLGVYEPESRRWLPHVTVLRFRERPRLRPPLPALGRFSPSEAALYHSVLRRSGAEYQVLESVALGGR